MIKQSPVHQSHNILVLHSDSFQRKWRTRKSFLTECRTSPEKPKKSKYSQQLTWFLHVLKMFKREKWIWMLGKSFLVNLQEFIQRAAILSGPKLKLLTCLRFPAGKKLFDHTFFTLSKKCISLEGINFLLKKKKILQRNRLYSQTFIHVHFFQCRYTIIEKELLVFALEVTSLGQNVGRVASYPALRIQGKCLSCSVCDWTTAEPNPFNAGDMALTTQRKEKPNHTSMLNTEGRQRNAEGEWTDHLQRKTFTSHQMKLAGWLTTFSQVPRVKVQQCVSGRSVSQMIAEQTASCSFPHRSLSERNMHLEPIRVPRPRPAGLKQPASRFSEC